MSAEPTASAPAPAAAPAASESKLKRMALPLAIGGGVLGVALLLSIGIGIGMAKRQFERKGYVTQIEKLKTALAESVTQRTEAEERVEKMREELKAKRDEIHELELKVDEAQQNAERGGKHEAAAAAPAAAHGEQGSAATPSAGNAEAGGTAKFAKKGDCVLSTGQKGADWKDCLGVSKPPVEGKGEAAKGTTKAPAEKPAEKAPEKAHGEH